MGLSVDELKARHTHDTVEVQLVEIAKCDGAAAGAVFSLPTVQGLFHGKVLARPVGLGG
jgi:hypothetical protein